MAVEKRRSTAYHRSGRRRKPKAVKRSIAFYDGRAHRRSRSSKVIKAVINIDAYLSPKNTTQKISGKEEIRWFCPKEVEERELQAEPGAPAELSTPRRRRWSSQMRAGSVKTGRDAESRRAPSATRCPGDEAVCKATTRRTGRADDKQAKVPDVRVGVPHYVSAARKTAGIAARTVRRTQQRVPYCRPTQPRAGSTSRSDEIRESRPIEEMASRMKIRKMTSLPAKSQRTDDNMRVVVSEEQVAEAARLKAKVIESKTLSPMMNKLAGGVHYADTQQPHIEASSPSSCGFLYHEFFIETARVSRC